MFAGNALRITPDNTTGHKSLEDLVNDYLKLHGYITASATYHDVMPVEVRNRLMRIFTPTSLYIRGRADRIAVHTRSDNVFEWEAKTHVSNKYNDLTIELLPLAHHLRKSEWPFLVKCLYIFSVNGREGGFWTDNLPKIREIWIPRMQRNNDEQFREWMFDMANKYFPDVKVIDNTYVGGSGDPFVIIDKSTIASLPDWRNLIN